MSLGELLMTEMIDGPIAGWGDDNGDDQRFHFLE